MLVVAHRVVEPLVHDLLDDGLADHEEVLMQGMFDAYPPVVLARFEVAVLER